MVITAPHSVFRSIVVPQRGDSITLLHFFVFTFQLHATSGRHSGTVTLPLQAGCFTVLLQMSNCTTTSVPVGTIQPLHAGVLRVYPHFLTKLTTALQPGFSTVRLQPGALMVIRHTRHGDTLNVPLQAGALYV